MKNFYRVLNSNIDEIKFHYQDSFEVIGSDTEYTVIYCSNVLAEELAAVDFLIVRV